MALDRLTKVDGGGISTTSDYRVGIITASKFVGPFDGTGGNFSGVVTATDGVFSGNVTIGGTLTYEDVSNIDSVGIITARKNILVGGANEIVGTPYNYFYGRGSGASGVSVYAAEASLELVGSNAGSHVSSLLFRTAGNDGIGFNYNAGGNVLELKSFDATGNNFQIHASGSNVSNLKNILKAVSGGAIELYHNNTKRLETTSTGIKAYGNDHLFTTESTGDCRIILQSDSDNNAENDNSAVVFRQDGSADIGAIGVNLTNSTSIPPSQELFVASSSGESAIILATGFSNGYNNAVERVRINNAGITTFTQNVFLNKDLDVDGHTNLDNVSVAGVTTFTDDVYFDGATAGRDITFDRSENKVHFKHNARAEFGQGSYNTQFKSDGVNFTLVHNPITAFYLYSNTFNVIGAGNRSGNTYDSSLLSIHNGVVKLGFELPNGGASSLDNIITTEKGITVGTGVTIERNGQATFSGITTGTIFKVPDATNAGGATNHIAIGDNSDLKLFHDSNGDAQIFNGTGHLTIVNNTSGKVINLQPKSGANGVIARYEGAVELYHNGTKKFETTSNGAAVYNIPNNEGLYLNGVGNNTCIKFLSTGSSPGHAFRIAYHSLTGYLYGSPALTFDKTDTSGNFDSHIAGISDGGFHLADNKKLHLGDKMSASGDLQIYHDGTNSFIKNTTGNLRIQDSNGNIQIQAKTGEESIIAKSDGAVELYFNNTKRIETTNTGAIVTGEVAASQDYPDFKPALDLNFSLTKKLDPRITFTRNGSASYVDENGDLKYSTNAPRFNHDPITKECKGLLMEKSKANLLLYSNQMNGGFNRTLENNTTDVVAPDGTNTAVKMILTSTAYGYAFPWNNNTTDSNRTGRRLSYWIKKGDYDQINLTNGNHLIFTFSTKSLTTSGTYTFREKVEEYPNDWYRVSYTIPEGSSNQTLIGKFQGSTNGVVAYFWGFQLEEDGYETSYIPTNGASVTRAVDSAVIDGEDFDEFFSFNGAEFNDYRGTLISFSESDYYANLTAARWNKVQLEQNNDNKVQLCIVGASSPYYDSHITYGTGTQADFTGSQGSTFPTVIKHGVAFAKNNAAYSYNGNTVETDNSVNVGGLPTATHGKYTQLTIGGQPSKAHIKRVMYYSQRISNTQLRNLTS